MQCQKLKTYMETGRVVFLPPQAIVPNPAQPRKVFDPQGLDELCVEGGRQPGVPWAVSASAPPSRPSRPWGPVLEDSGGLLGEPTRSQGWAERAGQDPTLQEETREAPWGGRRHRPP